MCSLHYLLQDYTSFLFIYILFQTHQNRTKYYAFKKIDPQRIFSRTRMLLISKNDKLILRHKRCCVSIKLRYKMKLTIVSLFDYYYEIVNDHFAPQISYLLDI